MPEAPRDILRFLTCGSVDDGKSTLIGRLLHDTGRVLHDQAEALSVDSEKYGSVEGGLDLALLVDGLQAEREQGITIDVAYRFFASSARKYIVADCPGHEQYTRNMATGASTADAALILVDARKGALTQTRRHSIITSLLGIRHAILVVNKMDLVDHAEDVFVSIKRDYLECSEALNFSSVTVVPVSALNGDNVCRASESMPWYSGDTLLQSLDNLKISEPPQIGPRLSVQWVARPDANFRGYAGTVVGSEFKSGDAVVVEPSGIETAINEIHTADGVIRSADPGDAIVVALTDDVDVSRGNVLRGAATPMSVTDQIQAHIIWMGAEPMIPGRQYLLQLGAQQATAWISALKYVLNVNTMEKTAAKTLTMNDIAVCNLSIDRELACDPYVGCRETGSFILIDRFSNETVCAGMVDFGLRRASNLTFQDLTLNKQLRSAAKGQTPVVVWLTGLSGAGKSTIANLVESKLHAMGKHTYILDGDNVRHGLNRDLGFTDADRVENIRRFAEVAKLFTDAGLIVIVSVISPFRSERDMARDLFDDREFLEVHVDAPLSVCEERDPKNLYAKARAGQIKNFTGIDSPYEPPRNPELRLDTSALSPEEAAQKIIDLLNVGT